MPLDSVPENALRKKSKDINLNLLLSCAYKAKEWILYIVLILEFYCMLYHAFIMRIWILLNFMCTCFYMYEILCGFSPPDFPWENREALVVFDKAKHPGPIYREWIKKVSLGVIISGVFLLVFFTNTIGITTIPLMLYLINRTIRNVFIKGF